MPLFEVSIEETRAGPRLIIEADCEDEAIEIYQDAWDNNQIDAVDFQDEIDVQEVEQLTKGDQLFEDYLN